MEEAMKTFVVRYRDATDEGCPVFSCIIKAYDQEHAEDKFCETPSNDGWEIVSVEEKIGS
jgi:hypothetical protein